ncbi:alpha/beta fold hydrolase [Halobacteriovorax sp. HLS]|uniref:alpha/beta fold hydrolase n=1 Tax=Halobacteriovorax sp. HLS TaxID=2234000 RepID=UPI000FDC5DBC|nr:alpha/beta hydrolase [Halobacteriovorax sp. HLS]
MYCIDTIIRGGQKIYFINENHDEQRDLVIMFHGFPDTAYGFDKQITQLKKKYNVIVPFMHGTLNNTDISFKRIHPREIILDVQALLKKFNPSEKRRVFLVGHDLGCFTAVGTYEAFPYHIKGLVHINGLGLQQFYSRRFNLSQILKSYYVFLVQLSLVRFIVTKLFPQFFLNLIYRMSLIDKNNKIYQNDNSVFKGIEIYKHLFRKVFTYIGAPRQKVRVPALFVWGNKDKFLDIPSTDEINQFYDNAQIRILRGGHWAHHSSGDQFNRILDNWLGLANE